MQLLNSDVTLNSACPSFCRPVLGRLEICSKIFRLCGLDRILLQIKERTKSVSRAWSDLSCLLCTFLGHSDK